MKRLVLTTATIALVSGNAAMAATSATALTDLNLRAGPGPQYEVTGVIAGDGEVMVEGCEETANWCQVTYDGQTGWAYGEYLQTTIGEQPESITSPQVVTTVDTVTVQEGDAGEQALAGGAFGAIAGAIIGGPAVIAAAAAAGMFAGGATVEEKTITYIRQNPVEPVFLDGEVVVGAQVPPVVDVYEIPDSEYSYLDVNGQTVVVEPEDRTIVTIVR